MFKHLRRLIREPSSPVTFIPGFKPFKKRTSIVHAHSWHTDKNGRILWVEDGYQSNILHDEGELFMLVMVFDTDYGSSYPAAAVPLYLGLDDRASLAESDTISSAIAAGDGEPSGSGYARIAYQIDATAGNKFVLGQDSGDYRAVGDDVTFTASGGDWDEQTNRFLCDVSSGSSGKLISSLPLAVPQTILDGSALTTNLTIKLSE